MPSFLKAYPHVTLNLSTRLQAFDFSLTGLDAAIHYVVCSPALVKKRQLRRPADVLGHTLIHQSTRPHAWRDWLRLAGVDEDAQGAGAGPKYELFSMIAQAVKAGLGLAVLPRFLVAEKIADGTLAVPFELTLTSDFAYYLVWPAQKASWRPLLQLRGWLREQVAPAA